MHTSSAQQAAYERKLAIRKAKAEKEREEYYAAKRKAAEERKKRDAAARKAAIERKEAEI